MLASAIPALAQTAPLRIAISLGDIPRMWGGPDGGFEGVRFGGYMVYDSLAGWDMSSADKASTVVPALAESWQIDPADPKRWIFKLRPGVTFHDGAPFNADAAIWNLDSIFKTDAPQFNSQRSAAIKFRLSSIASYQKVDDSTIAITTNAPNGMFIYEATVIFMVSPARFAALGNDWAKFAAQPSGTGPYKAVNLVPRERLELDAFAEYWDKVRVPKSAKTILIPMPDANTRVAALRSGQVDFIETLPPDAIESMKRAGFKVVTNVYPHVWIWRLNVDPSSPFADIRVRQAGEPRHRPRRPSPSSSTTPARRRKAMSCRPRRGSANPASTSATIPRRRRSCWRRRGSVPVSRSRRRSSSPRAAAARWCRCR